jgi:endonuclease YncB( thermonuclease family)
MVRVSPTDIRVIDGDTIALSGLRQHVRLVGFNAPETRNAGCQAEAQLGQRAKQRLQGLVSIGSLELTLYRLFLPARNGSNAALQSRAPLWNS